MLCVPHAGCIRSGGTAVCAGTRYLCGTHEPCSLPQCLPLNEGRCVLTQARGRLMTQTLLPVVGQRACHTSDVTCTDNRGTAWVYRGSTHAIRSNCIQFPRLPLTMTMITAEISSLDRRAREVWSLFSRQALECARMAGLEMLMLQINWYAKMGLVDYLVQRNVAWSAVCTKSPRWYVHLLTILAHLHGS